MDPHEIPTDIVMTEPNRTNKLFYHFNIHLRLLFRD